MPFKAVSSIFPVLYIFVIFSRVVVIYFLQLFERFQIILRAFTGLIFEAL
jgi:hypothetical protein